jgi:hypothetical protein
MNHTTGQVTSISGNVCFQNNPGRLGRYTIIAQPNTFMYITVKDRPDPGDGVRFVPSGTMVSDAETENIVANVKHQVDSGPTGRIEVTIGGWLYITQPLNGLTTYDFDIIDGIEVTDN